METIVRLEIWIRQRWPLVWRSTLDFVRSNWRAASDEVIRQAEEIETLKEANAQLRYRLKQLSYPEIPDS